MRGRRKLWQHRWLFLCGAIIAFPCSAAAEPPYLPDPANRPMGQDWPRLAESRDVELRIVELRIRERTILASDLLVYIDDDDRLYIPLAALAHLLDFPITVSGDGRTSGWFLRENQTLLLDPQSHTATVAGRVVPIDPGEVVWIDNMLHIRSDALDSWLLLRPGWQPHRQLVTLNPPYLIASEESARRARAASRSDRPDAMDTSGFVTVDSDYRWIGWPFMQANFSLGYDAQASPQASLQGSLLAEGDLLKHSARIALSGDSRGYLDGRVTFGRQDAGNRILGPARASLFEFGDIGAPPVPLLQRGLFGVGLRIAREPAELGGTFDHIDLIGSAPPGWQAELYRDHELLGFQIIGADGRYDFRGAPLAFGISRFRIQLYGPSGERHTIYRTVDVDAASLRPGELRYSLLAVRQGHSLLNGDGVRRGPFDPLDPVAPLPLFDRNATYLEARASHGLSHALAVRGLVGYRRPDDRRLPERASFGVGARLALGPLLVDGDAIVQNSGAHAGRFAATTGFGRFRLAASHDQYGRGFFSDENNFTTSPLRTRSMLSVDGGFGAIGVGAQFSRISQQDGNIDQFASIRMNMLVAGFSVANRVGWRRYSGPSATRDRIDGTFSLSGATGQLRARFGADYEIDDDRLRARRLRGEISYRLDGWYLALGRDRELRRGGFGQWSAAATRDWNGIRLGGELRYAEPQGGIRALLTLGFAMDRDPGSGRIRFGRNARSQRGAIEVTAFHDLNGNGTRDAGEAQVEGLSVVSDPRGLGRASEQGRVRIEELPVSQQVALRPVLDVIDDPYLIASTPGYLLSLRAGQPLRLDIPLIESGEIELRIDDADGLPVTGETVTLRGCDGGEAVRRENSAFDGRIFFDRIAPGCYRVEGAFDPADVIVEPGIVTRAGLRKAFSASVR